MWDGRSISIILHVEKISASLWTPELTGYCSANSQKFNHLEEISIEGTGDYCMFSILKIAEWQQYAISDKAGSKTGAKCTAKPAFADSSSENTTVVIKNDRITDLSLFHDWNWAQSI